MEGTGAVQLWLFDAPPSPPRPARGCRPVRIPPSAIVLRTLLRQTVTQIADDLGCDKSYVARVRRQHFPALRRPLRQAPPAPATPLAKRRCHACGRLNIADAALAPRCACGSAW
jgi:hypothetical protein